MEELSKLYLDLTVTIVFELLNILDIEFRWRKLKKKIGTLYLSPVLSFIYYILAWIYRSTPPLTPHHLLFSPVHKSDVKFTSLNEQRRLWRVCSFVQAYLSRFNNTCTSSLL